MTILIPMAGLSSRFTKAGYTLPKYMLYAKDKSLFALAVSSFSRYFDSCRFVFVARDVWSTGNFVQEECKLLGIKDFCIVLLQEPTSGQAETVLKGIESANIPDDESILIFNIDTFRPNYVIPEIAETCDGYLDCFVGSGANWSYAKTEDGTPNSKVVMTAEKKEISNYCSTGMYFFRRSGDFIKAYNDYNGSTSEAAMKERYVAPLYNNLIQTGLDVRVDVVDRDGVIFCGVPEEYLEYLKMTLSNCKN